jgi:HEAT repeat protein
MKSIIKNSLIGSASLILAAFFGSHLAGTPKSEKIPSRTRSAEAIKATEPAQPLVAVQGAPLSVRDLQIAWTKAHSLTELDPIAQALAEKDSAEAVQVLLDGIEHIKEWPVRAALAKNLRAVSNPEVLQTLLPALLNNYGRGNTILNEISDTIARLAQPETVEDLAALHWQASVQAGQGHKVLRTVASIRNPVAIRGLMRVAARDESPALVAAANEALTAIAEK